MRGGEIPEVLADLTPAWLTQILREHGVVESATVCGVEMERLAAGVGLIGCVARLSLCYEPAEAAAPATMIAKLPTDNAKNRRIGDSGDYEREVRFYRELAPGLPVRVPRCYVSRVDVDPEAVEARRLSQSPGRRFVLLLEDMAPARVGDDLAGCGAETAAAVLRAAACLHASLWESSKLDEFWWAWPMLAKPGKAAEGLERFDIEARAAFEEQAAGRLPDGIHDLLDLIALPGDPLGEQAREAPRTFLHTDFRLDNLCFSDDTRDAEVTFLDWQAAGIGPGAWDVASFLANSLSEEESRETEDSLLALYHETLCVAGVRGYEFARFERDYEIALLMGLRSAVRNTLRVDWEGSSAERRERALQRRIARLRRVDPDAILSM